MSRFNFADRMFFAADTGVVAPPVVAAPPKNTKPAEPFTIRKGSQAERIVVYLRSNIGKGADGHNLTVQQLADNFPKSRGEGVIKATSFESAISKIKTFMEERGKGETFAAMLPSDYSAGGQGTRQKREEISGDSLDDLLGE